MVSWWVIAVAVLFPLAQVPLVLWIGRYFALDEDEEPATPEVRELWTEHEASPSARSTDREHEGFDPEDHDLPSVPASLDASTDSAEDSPATVACPECGSENDVAFRFCGDCASALD